MALAISFSVTAGIKLASNLERPDTVSEPPAIVDTSPMKQIYDVSPYLAPISWGAVVGILAWRGRIRSTWSKQGYDYDVFKVVARMRGSPTRIKLLNSLLLPKNKAQLAKELEIDWKTVDNHIEILRKHSLIEEMALVGSSKYYIISEHGKKVLVLLSNSSDGSNTHQHDDGNTQTEV